MKGIVSLMDLDALNLILRGLTLDGLEQLIENAERYACIIAKKHRCSIYHVMRHSKSYNRIVNLPLTETYRYGEKNQETPAMVLCIGRRTSISTDILVQLKGFPLGKREYQIARHWLRNLLRGVSSNSKLTYLVSSFHIAVDFEAPITEFALERRRAKKVSLHFENGKLTGYYIGSFRSDKWLAIYDRVRKLQKSKIISTAAYEASVTRFELREKLPQPTEWQNLRAVGEDSLRSNNIVFYDIKQIERSPLFDDLTINITKQLGVHNVILAQPDDNRRRKLRRELSRFSVDCNLSKGFGDSWLSLSSLKYLCSNRKRWVKTKESISKKQFATNFL